MQIDDYNPASSICPLKYIIYETLWNKYVTTSSHQGAELIKPRGLLLWVFFASHHKNATNLYQRKRPTGWKQ